MQRIATTLGASLALVLGGPAVADVPAMLGGGNFLPAGEPVKFAVLQQLGLGMCRMPTSTYWREGQPQVGHMEQGILAAHAHGIEPMVLFEYYTRFGELGDAAKWRAIGRAFAERFRPNSPWLVDKGIRDWGVRYWSAINEPEGQNSHINPTPVPIEGYATALEALADGIHSVDPSAQVSPGGFMEVPLLKYDPYVAAVAPLYNAGKLAAMDIHRYWDVQWIPMDKPQRFSLQAQFDDAKQRHGITADIAFYTTEVNFKHRVVTEDEAAKGFLTALWDALTVVGKQGQRVSRFVMPWNILNTTVQDEHYGLSVQLQPWVPTARGEVLRRLAALTRGLEFVSVDPKQTGVSVLAGQGRTMWVWQNRPNWSTLAGSRFELNDLPPGATRVEVHTWSGLRCSVPVEGRRRLTLTDLPTDETLMMLALPAS
ncbi:MAG: hypothetical protein HUU35_05680 [Armatimonadetes bacterium]|nr:hypothetical protein [Armatimonadota bacterium]